MHLNLLRNVLIGAEPEAKYFLIRFIMQYGFDKSVTLTVKEAVLSFRMNDRYVAKAISFLVENNYLNRLRAEPRRKSFSVSVNGRGRPKSIYRPGAALLALREEWSQSDFANLHGEQIDFLLTEGLLAPKKVGEREADPNKLIAKSQLLLLVTLMAHADQNGIVENLSLQQLALLVGLSKEQIRWNIKALQRNMHLVRYIPGGTVQREKGRRISSIIVSGKLLADTKQRKHLFVLARFEMHFVLRKSVQLAIALMDSHENNLREVRKNGRHQYGHWSALYGVSDKEYSGILKYIDLYLRIGKEAKLGFDRFAAAVYACVEQLIRDYGFTLSDTDQPLEGWPSYFSSVKLVRNIQWIFKTSKNTEWFISWVFEFYEELRCLSLDDRCDMQIRSLRIRPILQDNVLIQVA